MQTIAVIGAGKLGELVLAGLVKAGHPVLVTTRRPARAEELTDKYNVRAVSNATAGADADVLLIATKPQDAGRALAELEIKGGKLVVSLCAGLTTGYFAERLPAETPVVRVMTNTPALVGQAMTAISPGPYASQEHQALVEEIFRPLGSTIRVPESQQDAVTALSGSGPAYFFLLVEAMADAGVLLGLPRATATELMTQTALGAATMLRESGESPAKLREQVTSPAGTTAAALRVMESHGVRAAMLDALEAARDRAAEIARNAA